MLILTLLYFVRAGLSLPISNPHNNCIHTSDGSGNDVSTRTTSGIVFSCLTTIFACTWTSVHPNIPNRKLSDWQHVGNGQKYSLLHSLHQNLLSIGLRSNIAAQGRASEDFVNYFLIVCANVMTLLWVGSDYLYANNFPNFIASCGDLTYTHGMFLVMGGFVLDGAEKRVLQEQDVKNLVLNHKVFFPGISKDEIMDRSKADGLTKTVTMVQTTWFIAQAISRAVQHLPITELELTTLGFAFLNVLIYVLWWNKPKDVQYPILVPLLSEKKVSHTLTTSSVSLRDYDGDSHNNLEDPGSSVVSTSTIDIQPLNTSDRNQAMNYPCLDQGSDPTTTLTTDFDWPRSYFSKNFCSYFTDNFAIAQNINLFTGLLPTAGT